MHSDKQNKHMGARRQMERCSDYLDTELHTNLIINTALDQIICMLRIITKYYITKYEH
jgi:hypothetical protein